MLIVCPTCETTYQIQLAALGGAGRSVRCTKCKNTWFATPDSVVEEPALMAAAGVNRAPAPPKPPAQTEQDLADEWASAADDDVMPGNSAPADQLEKSIVIAESPPLVPQDHAGAGKVDPPPSEDIETIAARRARQRYLDRKNRPTALQRIASLPVLIVALLAVLGAAVQWRVAVVRTFPQTASLYSAIRLPVNLRGLEFENVKSTGEFLDGAMVLVIEGTIVNPTRSTIEVPRLRFALRNMAGHEVYAWSALPSKTSIASGGELPFRTRLASPPDDGRDVIVRFFNRRDVTAGTQ